MKKPSKNSRIQAQMKEIHAKTDRIYDLETKLAKLEEENDVISCENQKLTKNNAIHQRNERFLQQRIKNLETTIFTMNRLFAQTAQEVVANYDFSKPTPEEITKQIKDTFSTPLTPADREAKIAGLLGLGKPVVQ